MTRYWFKPKKYGYGATPLTWEGWGVTFAYLALTLTALWWLIIAPLASGALVGPGLIIAWTAVFLGLSLVFALIAKRKTNGIWKWRWGNADDAL